MEHSPNYHAARPIQPSRDRTVKTIPNTHPTIELVEVLDFDDEGQDIRHQPDIGSAADPEHPGDPAEPITADGHGTQWGLQDKATGRAWVPCEQGDELQQT